jgi:hypothetical protein
MKIRIRIRMFLGLPGPHPDPLVTSKYPELVKGTGPDPHPDLYQHVTDRNNGNKKIFPGNVNIKATLLHPKMKYECLHSKQD